MERVYITVTAPEGDVQNVLNAIAAAGGGRIGEYTHCAFTNEGLGRFKPSSAANPTLGEKGEINKVAEWRIETFCERAKARAVVDAIRSAHSYDEPVIHVIPLLSEDDL